MLPIHTLVQEGEVACSSASPYFRGLGRPAPHPSTFFSRLRVSLPTMALFRAVKRLAPHLCTLSGGRGNLLLTLALF